MGYKASMKRAVEKIISDAGLTAGGGGTTPSPAASENVIVNTFNDLHALTEKKEGIIYIVRDEDISYLYDQATDEFISRVKEFDGGSF